MIIFAALTLIVFVQNSQSQVELPESAGVARAPSAGVTSLGVIPFLINEPLNLDRSYDHWVEVSYSGSPNGEPFFVEPGEKIWFIQDQALLILGSTGQILPRAVRMRTTVWVTLVGYDWQLGPIELMPRSNQVSVRSDTKNLARALGAGLPGIDATYLAQVAHFLAGNLASLAVQATSYEISSVGEVIDENGDWVGGRLEPESGGSVFVGPFAGSSDDGSNNFNTAIGKFALALNSSGYHNSALGHLSLYLNSSGIGNTAMGYQSMSFNTTGQNNVAIGKDSLFQNTDGFQNVAVGYKSLSVANANSNTAVGNLALAEHISGPFNTAIAHGALGINTTGEGNTAVGAASLQYNIDGDYNTAIGWDAGSHSATPSLTNSTAVGRSARTTAGNQVRIGNSSVTSIGGYAAWSTLSDKRFKSEIEDKVPGLSFINALKPVSYKVDFQALDSFLGSESSPSKANEPKVESGFLAQDVERLAHSLGFSFSGIDAPDNDRTPYALRYGQFVVPIVKAIQEQQQTINLLTAEIEALKHDLAALNQ